jgi:hypothetical protein
MERARSSSSKGSNRVAVELGSDFLASDNRIPVLIAKCSPPESGHELVALVASDWVQRSCSLESVLQPTSPKRHEDLVTGKEVSTNKKHHGTREMVSVSRGIL